MDVTDTFTVRFGGPFMMKPGRSTKKQKKMTRKKEVFYFSKLL